MRQRVVAQLSGAPHGFRPHSRVSPACSRHRGEHDKDHGGAALGSGQPPRFTSRPLMQPFGYESNTLSNRLHGALPTIPDGLPDLVGHVGYLGARADAPIPAMNDHLTGLDGFSKP